MPIIKDKYAAKGENIRSKFVTRKKNKAIYTETTSNPNLNTEQKIALNTESIRNTVSSEHALSRIDTENRPANITGIRLSDSNVVEKILTLSKGESLKEIIISHYHGSGTESTVDLHWSTSDVQDLNFKTVTSGVIVVVEGGVTFRLFSSTFSENTQFSLGENCLIDAFTNVSKDIYFYAVCSIRGPQITVIKC